MTAVADLVSAQSDGLASRGSLVGKSASKKAYYIPLIRTARQVGGGGGEHEACSSTDRLLSTSSRRSSSAAGLISTIEGLLNVFGAAR